MENDQITVLLTTCDKYSDAWEPFFYFFRHYWPECKYPIVINSEEKAMPSPDGSIKTIPGGKGLPWSKRLKRCLKKIKTEYVLLCLEDYFLQAPVDMDIFRAAVQTMNETPDLGVIQFAIGDYTKYEQDIVINKYFSPVPKYKKDGGNGRIYCVLSLYRTHYLKKLLLSWESPWEFETFGSIRTQFFREKVYRERENGPHTRCFQYYIAPEYGYGILRGKWLPKNKGLFAEHHLEVNFENLGIIDEREWQTEVKKYRALQKPSIHQSRYTRMQKILLPITHPKEFFKLLKKVMHHYKVKLKFFFPFLP